MLLKAEALVQMVSDDPQTDEAKTKNDSLLKAAYELVNVIEKRSSKATNYTDISYNDYSSKSQMEQLVLLERQRELMFEGKRWYDLLRYNYRHVAGVDYTTTLYRQEAEGRARVRNSQDMLNLVVRKYASGGQAAASKMRTEPQLYMPVYQSEMEVNPNLRQNPAYGSGKDYTKNY